MEKHQKKLGIFAIYALLYLLVHVLLAKGLGRSLGIARMPLVTIQLVSYVILGIWGIWLFREDFKTGFALWEKRFWKSLLWLVGGLVADYVLMTLFSMPLYLLNPEYELINENNVASLIGVVPGVLLLVICGILGPITEETIYRLIPVVGLRDKLPAAVAIALPGLLFGMVHMHAFTIWEFMAALPHVATGLVYGFVLHKSRNATIPVILHVLNNFPAILVMLLQH